MLEFPSTLGLGMSVPLLDVGFGANRVVVVVAVINGLDIVVVRDGVVGSVDCDTASAAIRMGKSRT